MRRWNVERESFGPSGQMSRVIAWQATPLFRSLGRHRRRAFWWKDQQYGAWYRRVLRRELRTKT